MDGRPTIGIDVGATKVVAAVVDGGGRLLRRDVCHRTPDSGSTGLVELLARAVDDLRAEVPDVAAVGVGTAGIVTWPEGEIEFAANHGHRALKLRRNLEQECGLPVVVDNDANAAAWAESRDLVGHGVLFLAVGTGVGSGIVVNGELMRGQHGRGAELGHVPAEGSDDRCACGLVGCLEVAASGLALERSGQRIVRTRPDGALARRARRPDRVTMSLMIDAALAGDPDVLPVVTHMGRRLGTAVARFGVALFAVDTVVVGGGLSALGRLLLDPLRSGCEKTLARSRYLHAPRIISATHGQDATLIGAALLAREVALAAGHPEEASPWPDPRVFADLRT